MNWRKGFISLHDISAAALAWYVAFLLRFNFAIPPANVNVMLKYMALVVSFQALAFWGCGLYRSLWRFASLPDLRNIVVASVVGTMVSTVMLFLYARLDLVPRSVLVMDPMILTFIMGGSRFLYRSWREGHLIPLRRLSETPVLILGAGRAAAMLLREFSLGGEWRAVGMLDDDANKRGRMLRGVPILGTLAEIEKIARERAVSKVILAIPSASPELRRSWMEQATAAGLSVYTVPALEELMGGRLSVSSVRPVELEDLLGRGKVTLDDAGLHQLLTGRVVMVTGAGGSIGSELCRQIARFEPRRIILFEAGEYALYQIEQEFTERRPGVPVLPVAGDVRNLPRLDEIFQRHKPEVVFHAAAYKHVPLMENGNCWEAVRNNVQGTLNVARMAQRHGANRFVLISTDKAVNPTNVMGATKRLAEKVCQSLQKEEGTRFVMVRFGNVLGSTGSVIPRFKEQIAKGGPVTVTHPDITRFFMLIPEAAQLVLQAGLMGRGGEIFSLDMGKPVKIRDLARDMIRLSGFTEADIKIVFTGLRPGEKLYEELLAEDESLMPTSHEKVRVARALQAAPGLLDEVEAWLSRVGTVEDAQVKADLKKWVPEYSVSVPPASAGGDGPSIDSRLLVG